MIGVLVTYIPISCIYLFYIVMYFKVIRHISWSFKFSIVALFLVNLTWVSVEADMTVLWKIHLEFPKYPYDRV